MRSVLCSVVAQLKETKNQKKRVGGLEIRYIIFFVLNYFKLAYNVTGFILT